MTQQTQKMVTSDFNLQKINTKELSEHISATIDIGGNIAIFGMRGLGKTEIAKYEINKSGCNELYLNLSTFERVDMGGYPDVVNANRKSKFVEYLLPSFYESLIEGNKEVVVLLDEVDKADQSVWAPLLEFTQFRSINGRKLPNLKAIIMTGNLICEGGQRPHAPLLDRSEKYLVNSDPNLWLDWAGKTGGIHPSITSYIQDHPGDLAGDVDPEDRYADCSPRGWTRGSYILYKGEQKHWSSNLLNSKICGCIGKSVGLKYKNYYDHYQQLLPLISDLFNGKDIYDSYKGLEPTKKLVTCMMVSARVAMELDNSKITNVFPKCISNIGKFFRKADEEIVFTAIRSQIQSDRVVEHSLDDHPDWKPIIDHVKKTVNSN